MSVGPILVVEDDPVVRKMLRVALESDGLTVHAAADGWSAMRSAERIPPAAVVSDLALPDMRGEELAERLRTLPGLGTVPLVACSGYSTRLSAAEGLFAHRLLKPVMPSRLLAAVRELVPREEPVGAEPGDVEPRSRLRILAETVAAGSVFESPREGIAHSLHLAVASGVVQRAAAFVGGDEPLGLVAMAGWPEDRRHAVAALFGHLDLVIEALSSERPITVPSPDVPGLSADDLLEAAGASSMALLPLGDRGGFAGVLVVAFEQESTDPARRAITELLAGQARSTLALANLAERVSDSRTETIACLAVAAEYRDDESAAHNVRMSLLCERLAWHLGVDDERAQQLRQAAVLHDIGKFGIADAILRKPGAFTPQEREEMKRHCEIGHGILRRFADPVLRLAADIALSHHEWVDGTGYPRGLTAGDIPLEGRIAAVADVYDALTSDRPYRGALAPAEALAIMEEERGTHFDPRILDALIAIADR